MVILYVFAGICGGLLSVVAALGNGQSVLAALVLYPVGGTVSALCCVPLAFLCPRRDARQPDADDPVTGQDAPA